MDYTIFILAIIVFILIYVLYVYFVQKSTTLTTTASLKSVNPAITALANPQSTRYAYGIWVYINTWDTTSEKTIFSRANNIKIYLDATKPSLYCKIEPNTAFMITDNFPVQKWVYLVISVDNQFVDAYLDGKLVNSTKVVQFPAAPGTAAAQPVVLGSGFDAFIAGFKNWGSPLGPQDVWNNYMSGNGGSVFSRFFSTYSANVSVLKDNVEQSKINLF